MKPADELRELIRGHRIPLRDKCADLLDECERVFSDSAFSDMPAVQNLLAKLRGEA